MVIEPIVFFIETVSENITSEFSLSVYYGLTIGFSVYFLGFVLSGVWNFFHSLIFK